MAQLFEIFHELTMNFTFIYISTVTFTVILLQNSHLFYESLLSVHAFQKKMDLFIVFSENKNEEKNIDKEIDRGSILNFSSDDTDNVMTFFIHCHYLWATPLKVCYKTFKNT